jgi:transposase
VGAARSIRRGGCPPAGSPKGSKLDAHAAFLLELIDASSHISLHEMQTRLREERGVSAGIGTLWRFLHARAITVKKNRPRLRARPARRQSRTRGLV